RNREVMAEKMPAKKGKKAKGPHTTAVLFNGGVFKADPLRSRMVEVLNDWAKAAGAAPVKDLRGADLDLGVARGGAYYGLAPRRPRRHARGGMARRDRRAQPPEREARFARQGRPHGASASAYAGDRDRHAGGLVLQPGRQAALEIGVQCKGETRLILDSSFRA